MTDYYPFGSERNKSVDGKYRYGFNGMERSTEDCGCNDRYTTANREYDARIGRWWSLDPKGNLFPQWSPYHSNFNNPNYFNDPRGDCPICPFVIPVLKGLAYLGTTMTLYSIGESMHETDKAYEAKNKGDMLAANEHLAKSGEHNTDLLIGGVTWGAGKLLGVAWRASKPAIRVVTSEIIDVSRWTSNSLGELGEAALRRIYGGAKTTIRTESGLVREVDNLVGRVAHESKVGYTSASSHVRDEFARDLQLLAEGEVDEVVWTFFRSPRTGKIGASKPLQDMFEEAQSQGFNIRSQILDVPEAAFDDVVQSYPNLVPSP